MTTLKLGRRALIGAAVALVLAYRYGLGKVRDRAMMARQKR